MKKQGTDVQILTNRYPISLPAQDYLEGIKIFRYFFFHSPLNYIRNRRLDLLLAWLFLKPITLFILIVQFLRVRPHVVNLHFPDHQIFECYLLKKIFGFKLIISFHGNEVERMCKISDRSIRYFLYERLIESAVIITGCSQYLLDKLYISFPYLKKNKCIILSNGVTKNIIEKKLYANKNDYVFSAGRFVPVKGIDLLINAFESILDTKLYIAGGDKIFMPDNITRPSNVDIHFLGQISSERIAKYLSKARLTVIPSRYESYGILLAEALCCGSPIIATNVGGIPELISIAKEKLDIEEKRIFDHWVKLVEPNTQSIRNGINCLLNNNTSIKNYIKIIPKIRSQFSWWKTLTPYLNILSNL